ncbi:SDR family NAD(P)-dependent oxidoreductase [Aquisediminimonas profunda]|uniref:SDR family NAD(P)-dependent oxidoreductase n=1 Tax=Aquisediminimonas profunda TaxID=1550733 RepID=UPI001C62951F|nr:glucose 1-dehydrogenase [Aquisediminimonas profunda]
MNRVKGKVAIITGAASPIGLGYASAAALLREGAHVMITDIDEVRIRAASKALGEEGHVACLTQDIADEDGWDRVIAETVRQFGRLDIMVNNAAMGAAGGMDVITLADWEKVISINLTGTFLGSRAAMRQMRAQRSGGSIINLSSIYGGVAAYPNLPAYTASKGGVRALSRTIALEGAVEGIRCNIVHPGIIVTEMQHNAPREIVEASAASVPMKRMGEPKDIANAVLFLACDESSYITGTEIIVDGGFTAQ